MPTCPAEASAGAQIAYAGGGQIVVLTQREVADQAGNFSTPVGFTPRAPGPVLLCAYSDDGATTTLARASLLARHGWKVRCAVTASNGAGATTAFSRTVRVR